MDDANKTLAVWPGCFLPAYAYDSDSWIGIILGGLLGLLLLAAVGLYLFGADPVRATAGVEIAPPPEVVFARFTSYDNWYDLWDVVEMTPPQSPEQVGHTFRFVEPDGTVVNGVIIQFEQDRVFAAALDMEGLDAQFSFTFTLEPSANGTHAVLHNEGSVAGVMKIMMVAYALTGELDTYYELIMGRLRRSALR